MKRYTLFLLFTFVSLFSAQAADKIKIGVIAPYSGNLAFIGESAKNSVLLAQEKIKNSPVQYEFLFEDSRGEAKQTVLGAQKLLAVDKVDYIISLFTESTIVSNLMSKYPNTVNINISWEEDNAKGLNNFMYCTPTTALAERMADELSKRDLNKIAILYVKTKGDEEILQRFEEAAADRRLTITSKEGFSYDSKDFRSMIAKAEYNDPNIYLLITLPPHLELIAKQIKDLHIQKPVTNFANIENSSSKDLFEGCWFVSTANANEAFKKKYEERFKNHFIESATNPYDVVLFIDQLSQKGKLPASDFIQKLTNLKFTGLLGSTSFSSEGVSQTAASVKKIEKGQVVQFHQ
jgi:ABC-type branched-subunit amino acid transport system substrate-binding protein